MTDREFYQSIGICPVCKKNAIYGNEKTCLECKAYKAEWNARWRENHREEDNRRARERKRVKSEILRAQGVCYLCGKRSADNGHTSCALCRDRKRKSVAKWRIEHPERARELQQKSKQVQLAKRREERDGLF